MNARALVGVPATLLVLLIPGLAIGAPGGKSVVGKIARDEPGASVNACGDGGGTFGVRVSVPWRGDDMSPWVRITVEYYSTADGAWHAVGAGGDSGWFQAGSAGSGANTGFTFPFRSPSAGHRLLMRGFAEVQWRGGTDSDSAELGAGACEVGAGDTVVTAAQQPATSSFQRLPTVTVRYVNGRPESEHAPPAQPASPQRAEEPRVVGDDSGDPKVTQPADPPRVVDRPDVQVPSGAADRPDQAGSDQPPVGHDGVTTPGANAPSGHAG